MLLELHIRDYALVEETDLEFGPGLNVLTGETGAGKSILIDALQCVLGGKAQADSVRTGAEEACIEAVFQVPVGSAAARLLAEQGLAAEEGLVILRRDIQRGGRGRSRINGHPATVGQLAAIGGALVEIHGQHGHQLLLRADHQRDLLDALGGEELLAVRAEVGQIWHRLRQARRELSEAAGDEREQARREELLRFQCEEIDRAALRAGEGAELEAERRLLQHAERLRREAARAYALLYEGEGGPAAVDILGEAAGHLQAAAQVDETLLPWVQELEQAQARCAEAAGRIRRYYEGIEADPGRLEEVEARLAQLAALKRKYGADEEEILAYRDRLVAELARLADRAGRREELAKQVEELSARYRDRAAALRALREQAAGRLSREAREALKGLGMAEPRFAAALAPAEPGPAGEEEVAFLFSANPGEELRPLARVASGGELSRVMLALKTVLAAFEAVPTLIFDEVDAGIGGRTAWAVALRLGRLASSVQVLCITHLAHIASMGDRHLFVDKHVAGGRTRVRARALGEEERVLELARMLGGGSSERALAHAREMLALARRTRKAS